MTCDFCGKQRHTLYPGAFVDGIPQVYVCWFCLHPYLRKGKKNEAI